MAKNQKTTLGRSRRFAAVSKVNPLPDSIEAVSDPHEQRDTKRPQIDRQINFPTFSGEQAVIVTKIENRAIPEVPDFRLPMRRIYPIFSAWSAANEQIHLRSA